MFHVPLGHHLTNVFGLVDALIKVVTYRSRLRAVAGLRLDVFFSGQVVRGRSTQPRIGQTEFRLLTGRLIVWIDVCTFRRLITGFTGIALGLPSYTVIVGRLVLDTVVLVLGQRGEVVAVGLVLLLKLIEIAHVILIDLSIDVQCSLTAAQLDQPVGRTEREIRTGGLGVDLRGRDDDGIFRIIVPRHLLFLKNKN